MIALPGATGFLGQRVARRLAEGGHAVRCLVRGSSDTGPLRRRVGDDLWPTVEVVTADLLSEASCREALAGCDVLLHVAAGLSGSTSTLFLSGASATKSVLAAAADAGVRRAVVISSMGVFNGRDARGGLVDEDTPIDADPPARDPYSYAKIVQEREARRVADERGLPLVVLRPGVIIGPGRGAVSGRCGLKLGGLLVQMGGGQELPYTYVDNCADAVALAATAEGVEGRSFNLVDDDRPTASQAVRAARRHGDRFRRAWVPGPLVPSLCGAYHLYSRASGGQLPPVLTRYRATAMWGRVRYDNAAAKAGLGWTPRVPMGEALRRAVTGDDPAEGAAAGGASS